MARPPRLPAAPLAAEIAALAVILAVGAVAAGRHLATPSGEFDEGVYLASADALDRGARLGPEVFASQPPLFFLGLRAAAAATGGDAAAMRACLVVLFLGGVLAAAAVARPLAGPAGGCLAALLVALSPQVVDRAAVVSADVPSLSLGLLALAAAQRAVRRTARAAAIAAGALAAAAVLVKLLALPFAAAAIVAVVRGDRAVRRAAAAGSIAVVLPVLVPFAGRWGSLWQGAVGMRDDARGVALAPSPPDPGVVLGFAGLALALAGALVGARRKGPREWLAERAALVALLACAALLLAVQRPLFLHHWALLSIPMAVLAASSLAGRRMRVAAPVAGAAVLLLLPGAIRGRVLLSPPSLSQIDRVAAVIDGSVPPGGRVVSDMPLVPLAAGRPAVASTIDASFVRVGSGALPLPAILAAAGTAEAVVVGRAFVAMPRLVPELRLRFPRAVTVRGATVFLRGSPSAPMR